MAANSLNIDVITDTGNIQIPNCPHGPMLMFTKYCGKEAGRKFFACSAFRDRKDCGFFQWVNESLSLERQKTRNEVIRKNMSQYSHKVFSERYKQIKKLSSHKRSLCYTCDLLLLPEELSKHKEHKLLTNINDAKISNPLELFRPKDDNKTFAQFFFSKETVDFVINQIQSLGFTHVLCIGSPRIFHAIESQQNQSLKTLLLDLDSRFGQVWPPGKFCRFNMFNNHLFEEENVSVLENFIADCKSKNIVLVMDPPFGGMVEPIAETVKKISKIWHSKNTQSENSTIMPIMWFFPYFLEKHIIGNLPEIKMLDYKVDYDNHSLYKTGKKKKGSPVRIFTNISQSKFKLPEPEYWYCKICERYSASTNVHCQVCESCTSKDGTTYRHCFDCNRCVKATKSHCQTCNTCQLSPHTCLTYLLHRTGCHICGSPDHKRKFCPQTLSTSERPVHSRKRKLEVGKKCRKKAKKKRK